MANIGTTVSEIDLELYLKQGSTTKRTITINYKASEGEMTAARCERLQIAAETADHTYDLGDLTSYEYLVLIFSEEVDNVYTSTIVGAELVGVNCHAVIIGKLSSLDALHIDATNSSSDVTCDIFLLSDIAV